MPQVLSFFSLVWEISLRHTVGQSQWQGAAFPTRCPIDISLRHTVGQSESVANVPGDLERWRFRRDTL